MSAAPSWSFAADGKPIKAEAVQSLRQAGGRLLKGPPCCYAWASNSTTVLMPGSFVRNKACPGSVNLEMGAVIHCCWVWAGHEGGVLELAAALTWATCTSLL